jgi:hypothetical protein
MGFLAVSLDCSHPIYAEIIYFAEVDLAKTLEYA